MLRLFAAAVPGSQGARRSEHDLATEGRSLHPSADFWYISRPTLLFRSRKYLHAAQGARPVPGSYRHPNAGAIDCNFLYAPRPEVFIYWVRRWYFVAGTVLARGSRRSSRQLVPPIRPDIAQLWQLNLQELDDSAWRDFVVPFDL